MTKPPELTRAMHIIKHLEENHIHSCLYGSLGVSIYLGAFKDFADIDLLIEPEWLNGGWQKLESIMEAAGFVLLDEKEHEFRNSENLHVAFAPIDILVRDGIIADTSELVTKDIAGLKVQTLSPQQFLTAYEFSLHDGYRQGVRAKKDEDIINQLTKYIGN